MESRYNARMSRGRRQLADKNVRPTNEAGGDGLIRVTGITRREALRLGLVGAGLAAFPESLVALATSARGPGTPQIGSNVVDIRIDAHTHIFNARDISVAGILRNIEFESEMSPLETVGKKFVMWLIPDKYEDALTGLMHLLATRAAPTLEEERTALVALRAKMNGVMSSGTTDLTAAFFKAVAEENLELECDVRDIVTRALTELLHDEYTDCERERVIQFMMRLVAMRYQNAARLFEVYGEWPVEPVPQCAQPQPDTPAKKKKRGKKNACSTAGRPATEGRPDAMNRFTPAMVDMSLWLDDESPFPMMEHVKLYSEIAELTGGGLLPFAAFDPWRQAFGAGKDGADRGLPLKWVQEAVDKYGFIGVKLYPAMGFLPMRNALYDSKPKKYWPRNARKYEKFGAGLDQVLGELYSWCEANDVPVLAHTNSSMGSHSGYAKRGRPREWGKVLSAFPKLRLNLGHFGGWGDVKDADGWSLEIVRLMEQYEHVYADMGAFDYIDMPKRRPKLARGLAKLLKKHPVVAERLLYASDWFMANSTDYLADFETLLELPGLEKLREGFFGANAARYLGLGEGGPNRAKLTFHTRNASPMIGRESFEGRRR